MKICDFIRRKRDTLRRNRYELKPYLVKDGKSHPFALICPGGGYSEVCSFGEGRPFAEELNKSGYHAFVVYYRVKDKAKYPNPQDDLERAVREIFGNSERWRVETEGWSLWGSSAGGHLAASYCTEKRGTPKPSALILVYPVITMGEHTHEGSRNNLLGKNPSREMIDKLSVEKQAGPDYPPVFAWYGTADDTVGTVNTEMLAKALERVSVTHKVEAYEGIGHGAGLAKGTAAEVWLSHAVEFWESQRKALSEPQG